MIYLRELEDKDINTVKKWIMQKYVSKWFGDVSDWEKELQGRKGKYSFIKHFIAEVDGESIGFCQYYDWNCAFEDNTEPAGTYGIDYLIGKKELLGKGLGKEIVKVICDKVIECERKVVQFIADPTIEEKRININSIKVLVVNGFCYDEKTKFYKKFYR